MTKVRISNDERLITMTKEAYDEMVKKVEQLEDELANLRGNVILRLTVSDSYKRGFDHCYIDVFFPEKLESFVSVFKKECEDLKASIEKRHSQVIADKIEINKMVDSINARTEILEKQKLLPKWILWLFRIKL